MADSSHDSNHNAVQDKSRRRAVLVALLGAGAPLSQKVIPGKWAAPVVNAVMLPAHAQTSEEPHPVGTFGSVAVTSVNHTSGFEKIAERSEEEILDLFVRAAEADTCNTNSSCDADTASVDVVATIQQNPSSNECLQARVNLSGGSCSSTCLIFDFTASVNGQSVSVSQSCDLQLTDMTLTNTGLSGTWRYVSGGVDQSDNFSVPANALSGCGSLSCP